MQFYSKKKNEHTSSIRARNLRFESLETRELLSVSPSDYAIIRENYQTLNLPETLEEINVIEIDAQDFAGQSLQNALDKASETPEDDLIVLKADESSGVFNLADATLRVDVDSDAYGSISIVSYGRSGASTLVSTSPNGAFDVVQGDLKLGGLLVAELGADVLTSPAVGLQTDKVAFVCQAFDSSTQASVWAVDYQTEEEERVFLTGLDETQALALATTSTDKQFQTNVYYDADKSPELDSDEHICWAAAAANILWYTGWGQTGEFSDEQELFENVFVNNFSDKAGSSYYASKWFITGEYPKDLDDTWSKPTSGGGYYQQAFKDASDSVDAYVSHSNFLTSPSKTSELANKLQSGYGISISVEWFNKTTGVNENAHSITLWGYSYNASLNPTDHSYYTSVYFTDSDDYQSAERELKNKSVTWRSSVNIEGNYQGAYVVEGYDYNHSGSNTAAAITAATYVAQRPSKYASSTESKPNLYPVVVADGVSLLLTTSASSTKNSDSFLANSTIYTNFAFKSTQDVKKTVKCQLWLDGVLYKTTTYSSLKANQSYGPGSTNISLGKLGVGTHTLRLVVDSDSAVDEYNENDNFIQRTFYVLESDSIFVTTAKDVVNANDGVTSLREAISLAGTSGHGSTIRFDSSLKGQTIKLSSSLAYLYVQRAITIDASTIWDEEKNAPGITIDGQGKTNAFCITGGTASQSVKLVGLKIVNGSGFVPDGDVNAYGGAVYMQNYLDLVDCVFESNKANVGGAIYCYSQGSLSVQNCAFNKNVVGTSSSTTNAGGLAGAIYVYEGSLTVSEGSFTENSSPSAGAVLAYNSQTTISGTSFVNNVSTQYAGACYFQQGTVDISDAVFTGNQASLSAGALEFIETTVSVSQSVFTHSKSGQHGGAVYVQNGSSTFTNCEFRGNTTAGYGGGVFLYGQNQHYFSNCALVDNTSDKGSGDALFIYSGTSEPLLATMRNSTVAGNAVSAIYVYGNPAGIKLYNSIVVGSTYDVYVPTAFSTVEAYNVLSKYTQWTESSKTLVYDDSKPLFTDAENGDYSLAFQSQALDVGLNTYALDPSGKTLEKDILGVTRVICQTVDLGAYERELEATPETPTNLTIGKYDAAEKTLSITWEDNSDVEYYYVVETSTDGEEWRTLKKATANTTSVSLSEVEPGTSHFVRVSAKNRAGASSYVFANRYVSTVPTEPKDVLVLKIDDKEKTTYSVVWNDKSTNESYFVAQVSTDGKTWNDYAKTNANVKFFETTDELQYVRVAAGNDSGLSAYTTGKTPTPTLCLETTAGSGLRLKLDGVEAETILWDFGGGVKELPNGAIIDPSKYGLTPGVSAITAQYEDADGTTQKSTVAVRIAETSPSLDVDALPSVNPNAAVFRINANFSGRVVDRNWRVDWGDGTSTIYKSSYSFFAAKCYESTKKTTSYAITITLLDDSNQDVETFNLGAFTPTLKTRANSEVLTTTGAESVFDQVFEEVDELEESEEAINGVVNSQALVYGPLYVTDVFAICGDVDDDLLRKTRGKKGIAF